MVTVDILEPQPNSNPYELFEKIGVIFGDIERLKIFIKEEREKFTKINKKKDNDNTT